MLIKLLNYLLVILHMLIFAPVWSQIGSGSLSLEQLDAVNGLEGGYNDFIKMDSRGEVWISSTNGLFRYDGQEVELFLDRSDNIQSNFFEDAKGNIWFTTYQEIYQYIRELNAMQAFRLSDENGTEISENYHLFFLEQNRFLWLKASDELLRYDTKTKQSQFLRKTKGVRFAVDTTSSGVVKKIFACPWYNGSEFEEYTFSQDALLQEYSSKKNKREPFTQVSNVLIESDSLVWLFTDQGLVKYNPLSKNMGETNRIEEKTFITHHGLSLNNDKILIQVANKGVWFFDKKANGFSKMKTNPSRDYVRTLYLDKQNHLWLSLNNNEKVNYQWFHKNYITNLMDGIFFEKKPVVTSMIPFNNQIISTTRTNQMLVFSKEKKILEGKEFSKIQEAKRARFPKLKNLQLDPLGHLWALADDDVYKYDEAAKVWTKSISLPNKKLFFAIHVSSQKKLISTNKGLFEVYRTGGKWEARLLQLSQMSRKNLDVFQMFPAQNNCAYIPYSGKNLLLLCPQNDTFQIKYQKEIGAEVYSVWEDSLRQRIWLGTSSGLYHYSSQDPATSELTLVEGTNSKLIAGVTGDHNGGIWASTNSGILFHQRDTTYNFRLEDGLPSDAFSLYTSLTDAEGKIWFGANDGLVVFHPDSVKAYPYGPRVALKEIKVNNESWDENINVDEVKKIDLSYDENNLSFDWSNVTYYLAKYSKMKYRLLGYDDNWVDLESKDNTRFSQLDPKQYTLEIYGINANGVKGSVRQLLINIQPPWWQSWWARVLFVLTFFGTIYGAFRWYVLRQLKEQQRFFARQQALQEERNRIAGELHDDLGAGLSIIRFLSGHALDEKESTSGVFKNVNRIYQSAGELLEKMGDIIWAMNAENDTLENLVNYFQSYAYEYLDINQLECEIVIQDKFSEIEWSGERRRNILLAGKEILHNIVKHAQAQKVRIAISENENCLTIKIKDDGIGFDPTSKKPNSNGLNNLERRMKTIGGKVDFEFLEGTQVQLIIPL